VKQPALDRVSFTRFGCWILAQSSSSSWTTVTLSLYLWTPGSTQSSHAFEISGALTRLHPLAIDLEPLSFLRIRGSLTRFRDSRID